MLSIKKGFRNSDEFGEGHNRFHCGHRLWQWIRSCYGINVAAAVLPRKNSKSVANFFLNTNAFVIIQSIIIELTLVKLIS